MVSTADAVDREVAWLADPSGGLLKAHGGPWDVIQAYWPRTPATRKTGVYVLRQRIRDQRVANQRKRPNYLFMLKLWWPIGATTAGTQEAEQEQRAFDAAIDLLLQRVRGSLADKTHGSFLSVGEVPEREDIQVHIYDPEQTLSSGVLRAEMTYPGDDVDVVI